MHVSVFIPFIIGIIIIVTVVSLFRENSTLNAEFDPKNKKSIEKSLEKGKELFKLKSFNSNSIVNNFISEIVYINLDTVKDRRKQIEHEIDKIFGDKVTSFRFPAVRCSYNGALGCLMSHVAILKKFLSTGKNVLILEDDFMFITNFQEIENRLNIFNKYVKGNWDVIQFGGYCVDWARVVDKDGNPITFVENDDTIHLMRLYKATTTSGYLVHHRFIQILYEKWNTHLEKVQQKTQFSTKDHLDQVQISLQKDSLWYGFSKPIGIQREGWSSIENKKVNNAWTFTGSLTEFINFKQKKQKIHLRSDFFIQI